MAKGPPDIQEGLSKHGSRKRSALPCLCAIESRRDCLSIRPLGGFAYLVRGSSIENHPRRKPSKKPPASWRGRGRVFHVDKERPLPRSGAAFREDASRRMPCVGWRLAPGYGSDVSGADTFVPRYPTCGTCCERLHPLGNSGRLRAALSAQRAEWPPVASGSRRR
jgi:hypothetical protein